MRIAVLGTGTVGRAMAAKLADLGHEVTIGTRDVAATMARTGPDAVGNPPFSEWKNEHDDVALASASDAAATAELVINATTGGASISALEGAGEGNLADKVLLDISNPLDFSAGLPPSLLVTNTDSLAEQIQRRFPAAKVVKSLNTMSAYVMVDPKLVGDGDHTVFVSGNDNGAKAQVTELLRSFGWTDVIDMGDLTTARGTEALMIVWWRLWDALDNPMIQFKVVR